MQTRHNLLFDLARVMIKQARLLKAQGMFAEARAAALRAIDLNSAGHASARLQPVRVRARQRR